MTRLHSILTSSPAVAIRLLISAGTVAFVCFALRESPGFGVCLTVSSVATALNAAALAMIALQPPSE